MVTLAWVFTFLPGWPATRRVVGWITASVFAVEVAIIDLQAWRGTASHFNIATPLDAVLFSTMGIAIVVQTMASVAVAVALWRQPFRDRAMGWALRLGMTLTIAGAASGGLMTRPTAAQLAEAARSDRLVVAGAHTVVAPDGGPGLPGTGWSTSHGDLRVPHFLGLHALQAMPLILWLLRRTSRGHRGRLAEPRTEAAPARLVLTAAASYASLFAILLWQALRGESLIDPHPMTLTALAAWLVVTMASVWLAARRPAAAGAPALGV
jgi:hypothetical protein